MSTPSNTSGNNLAAFPDKAAIKAEAGEWLVRMDSQPLSDSELRALQAWTQRSHFHRDYLLKLAANWESMAVLQELATLFPLPESEANSAGSEPRRGRWERVCLRLPRFATAAVVGVIVVGLTAVLGGIWQGRPPHELNTAVGEQASYTLPDGSVISLNTNTLLKIEFNRSQRAITLVRGEANFEVAKNPERPFLVYAGDGLVWAVGTAFNVRYLGHSVDVLVTEGRVKVFSDTRQQPGSKPVKQVHAHAKQEPPTSENTSKAQSLTDISTDGQEALIGAGQAIRYAQVIEPLQPVMDEGFERQLAWQRGSLIFKGETLREALFEIGRYTDKELVIVDPALNELKVGGHYKTDDIPSLLASLSQGLNIAIRYDSGNRILLSPR